MRRKTPDLPVDVRTSNNRLSFLSPRFVFSASTNAGRGSSFPKNSGRDPFAVTSTGWYTLRHKFSNNSGVLAVTLSLINSSGVVLHTWTLSDPSDVMSVIGGNRYGWFASNEFNFLAFDNSARNSCSNNVALASFGSTAVASSTVNANFPASGVIDGERNGNTWGAGGGWNDGTRSVFPDNVQVNFNVLQTLREIDVYTLKNQPNNGSVVNDTTPATSYGITISNNEFDSNFRAMLMFYLSSSEISGNNMHNSNGDSADIRIFDGNNGLNITCNQRANGGSQAALSPMIRASLSALSIASCRSAPSSPLIRTPRS